MRDPGNIQTLVAGPLRVQFSAFGDFKVGWDEPDWLGPGRMVVPSQSGALFGVSEHEVGSESDGVAGTVSVLDDEPVVVLRLEALAARHGFATGDFATPSVAWHFDPSARVDGGAPDGMRAFGHQYTEFALPVFSDAAMSSWRLLPFRPAVVMPLGLVAPDGRTILLAPLQSFHEQIVAVPPKRAFAELGVRAGWHGDLDDVPAGFATELAIIAGTARATASRGGLACCARDRRSRRPRATPTCSAHACRTGPTTAARIGTGPNRISTRPRPWSRRSMTSKRAGFPSVRSSWTRGGTRTRCCVRSTPTSGSCRRRAWSGGKRATTCFPTASLRCASASGGGHSSRTAGTCRRSRRTSTRCRCGSTPTARTRKDGELYERLLDQAVAWGVEVFEHDWLIECFLGVRGLRAAPGRAAAWQEGIDDGLDARNLHAQWCMASPADFAQASRLRHVTSIRTSGDHGYLVGPELLWAWFLHTNVMARALGLWPYKDVFHSAPGSETREVEALLSALSAGPVGIGDRIGEADIELIRRTCRADGVLVRPDVPVAAVDRAMFDAPVWIG